jgi:hypothetical protein
VRRLIAGLAVLGVLGLALLPPEHLHVTRTDDGRHSDVIHRHYEPHHPAAAEASVGHEDDEALWLDSPFTSPKLASKVYPVNQCLNEELPLSQAQQTSRRTLPFVHVSVHDPPSATSHGLRAPPFLLPDLI